MKNVILITCGIFFALSFKVQASDDKPLRDTFSIHLKGRNRAQIVGNSLEEIGKSHRVDSLKNQFISDLQKAFKSENFPSGSKMIYYFVAASGKRRLKAATDENQEINIDEEKKRLAEDLPSYHYVIFDMKPNMDIHLFLEDTTSLKMLSELSLDKAMHQLSIEKSVNPKSYYASFDLKDSTYSFRGEKHLRHTLTLSLGTCFGAVLLFNKISPTAMLDLSLSIYDKNKIQQFRTGITSTPFLLVDFNGGEFSNYNSGAMFNFYLKGNVSDKDPTMTGIEGGIINMYDIDRKRIYKGFDLGVCLSTHKASYSFVFAGRSGNDKMPVWIFTAALPF